MNDAVERWLCVCAFKWKTKETMIEMLSSFAWLSEESVHRNQRKIKWIIWLRSGMSLRIFQSKTSEDVSMKPHIVTHGIPVAGLSWCATVEISNSFIFTFDHFSKHENGWNCKVVK